VSVPERVLIAGKWWRVAPYTPSQIKRMRTSKASGKGGATFGECNFHAKRITYHPVQHKEELLDTLVHEGFHGILAERSYKFGNMAEDEDAVSLLVADLMSLIKQVATVELRCAR
jgi:hypothetical protein